MLRKITRFLREAYLEWDYPGLWRTLLSDKKKYVYYGYLGDFNFGDVMVHQATEIIFGDDSLIIPYKRRMPLLLGFLLRNRMIALDGIIVGGGTIMKSAMEQAFFTKAAASWGLPVFFHGTGSTSGIGQMDFWRTLLERRCSGGVRGPMSVAKIEESLGLKVPVVGDAALGLFEAKLWRREDGRGILVNLGTHHDFAGRETARLALTAFVRDQVAKGEQVGFLPMHAIDVQLAEKLREQVPSMQIHSIPRDLAEAVGVFHQYAFAAGERLHFNIIAAMAKTPFLSINYRPKHNDFFKTTALLHAGCDPLLVTPGLLLERYEERKGFAWEAVLPRLEELRDRQFSAAKQLIRNPNFTETAPTRDSLANENIL
ncbi:MAG: polysaccharide pyruvyl transferase family protein [Bacteroidota bacterium]